MKPSKQELRNCVRQQKKAMTPEEIAEKSRLLCGLVLQSDIYRQSKSIYGYLPFNQEVNLLPLLQQALADGKQVALPQCSGKEMHFILTRDLSRIQISSFGAPEPVDDVPVAQDKTALVLVPGLVFDSKGYRIGYGGGYYDRYLAEEPYHPTIGLCYDFQLTVLPEPEPHDIPVDIVFSI